MQLFENNPISTGRTGKKYLTREVCFTPCTASESLLEAVSRTAQNAAPEDVLLLSSACSNFDQFRNHQRRVESSLVAASGMPVDTACATSTGNKSKAIFNLLRGFYEEKTTVRNTKKNHHLTRKDAYERQS